MKLRFNIKKASLTNEITTTKSDISFASLNQINSISTDFIAAGFTNNYYIRIEGSVANDKMYKIASVTTNQILLTDYATLVNEGAGAAITISGASWDASTVLSAGDKSNCDILVKINNVNVINDAFDSFTPITTPISCTGGIVVESATLENDEYFTIVISGNTFATPIPISFSITGISKTNAYTNVFNLYGYDIGNNPTAGIMGNPELTIYLTNTRSTLYEVSAPYATNCMYHRIPGTSSIYFINTHSLNEDFTETIKYLSSTVTTDMDDVYGNLVMTNVLITQTTGKQLAYLSEADYTKAIYDTYSGKNIDEIWSETYYIDDVAFPDYFLEQDPNADCTYIFTNYFYYPDITYATGVNIDVDYYDGTDWINVPSLEYNTIVNGDTQAIAFSSDGSYRITISMLTKGGTTILYDYIIVTCNATTCLLDKFEDMLNACTKDDCIDADYYQFNMGSIIMGFLYPYQYEMQERLDNSESFSTLALFSDTLHDRLNRFCNSCVNNCTDTTKTDSSCC